MLSSEIEQKLRPQSTQPESGEGVNARTPAELLDIIEQKGKEIQEALAMLRGV